MHRLAHALFVPVAVLIALGASPLEASGEGRTLIRVHEDGSGITREIVREGWDVASFRAGEWVDLVVTQAELAEVASRSAAVEVLIEDLTAAHAPLRAAREFGAFHTYAEIQSAFDSLEALYPALAKKYDLGDSHEGRDILALKITDNVSSAEGEPEVLIVGCHHAREIISVEMAFLFAEYLLDNYGTDSLVTALVDSREIWIVPLLNPDGHQYVVDFDSGWRKNRRDNGDGTYGVDLNRNYPYMWGYDDIGSSPNTDHGNYRGPSPASEPEIQAILGLFESRSFVFALSFHSYGRMYLYPWGYVRLQTEDDDLFATVGDSLAAGNGYAVGNGYTGLIYTTNGGSDDYAYADTSKPKCFSFTPEVGDEHNIPESMIPVHFGEQLPAMMFAVRNADRPYSFARPGAPAIAAIPDDDDGTYLVSWTRGDGDTNVARWELVEATGETFTTEDAESGIDDWITETWTWNDEKSHSGQYSFYSGTGNQYNAPIEALYPLDVEASDSLVFWAWWRLENEWDYWYVEVSTDGGKFWSTIPGSYTTNDNPNGNNIGNGITGNSSSVFQRCAFDLSAFAGESVRVRWRYSTDQLEYLRGVQIDDIENVRLFGGVDTLASDIEETSYLVAGRLTDSYFYWVRGIDQEESAGYWSGIRRVNVDVTSTDIASGRAPLRTALGASVPNPFNPTTTIHFSLSQRGPVDLAIYDIAGRVIRVLASGARDAGNHTVVWDGTNSEGRDVASGIYLYRMSAAGFHDTKKLVLLR
ncbi:MAG: M14 family zinc carboxypeptidase [Candidatus Eisenbacteria bacterium]